MSYISIRDHPSLYFLQMDKHPKALNCGDSSGDREVSTLHAVCAFKIYMQGKEARQEMAMQRKGLGCGNYWELEMTIYSSTE